VQLSIDNINALEVVKSLFEDIDRLIRKILLMIARELYEETVKERRREIDADWIEWYLEEYDPTSKYIYVNEIDRKRARLVEAVIASDNKPGEVQAALRSVSLMGRIYAVRMTDEAVLQAYRDDGVELVEWESEDDSRVCAVCQERDGQIYTLDTLPRKPHINCRCWYRSVESGRDGQLAPPRAY